MDINSLIVGSAEFEPYVMHAGNRWKLYLNAGDQRYLGRSYAWLVGRHVPRMGLDELWPGEVEELFGILHCYRNALTTLGWNPGLVNCSWLGNEVDLHDGHGHMHFVPRYESPPKFQGLVYPDERWGKDYKPHEKLVLPDEHLFAIRDAITDAFHDTA